LRAAANPTVVEAFKKSRLEIPSDIMVPPPRK
jgi:hypothetical protein